MEIWALVKYEVLIFLLCTPASVLLAALWGFREVHGYTERTLKIALSMTVAMAIAVAASALYVNFPGWLFLLNIIAAAFIGGFAAIRMPGITVITGFFGSRCFDAPPEKRHHVGVPRSGPVELPIKPITHAYRGARKYRKSSVLRRIDSAESVRLSLAGGIPEGDLHHARAAGRGA